jgi:hypothetical protein
MKLTRLGDGPIIEATTPSRGEGPPIGNNIQGPSLIRTPTWIDDPLGTYSLYFADHKGSYIRLAHADAIIGPWTVYAPGSLQLADSTLITEPPAASPEQLDELEARYVHHLGAARAAVVLIDATTPHIASPDVHVDEERQQVVMYFHGLARLGVQLTKVATSSDGLTFAGHPEALARPYLRAFAHDGMTSALAMPGVMYRSADGMSNFEEGPGLFMPEMRHSAVVVRDGTLHVFWTRVGDTPESMLHSTISLDGDWSTWSASDPEIVLQPEHTWEGADAPLEPSERSVAHGHVNQLRDPAFFEDVDGRSYLLYAVAGESGIAVAEIDWEDASDRAIGH